MYLPASIQTNHSDQSWELLSELPVCPQFLFQQYRQSISYPSLSITFLNRPFRYTQSGFSSNSRVRLYMSSCLNSSGRSEQSLSRGIDSFLSMIFQYFSFLPLALRFCQGRDPLTKQSRTLAIPQMSSLLPCSIPKWVFREAYLAVPVKFLLSRYGICEPSFNRYFLASPKSMIYTLLAFLPLPITKLSGLISLWRKPLFWINSILSIIWQPICRVDLRSNLRPLVTNRSQSDCPNKSITITLYSPSLPQQQTCGIPQSVDPSSPEMAPMILASQKSCGLLLPTVSSLTATSV